MAIITPDPADEKLEQVTPQLKIAIRDAHDVARLNTQRLDLLREQASRAGSDHKSELMSLLGDISAIKARLDNLHYDRLCFNLAMSGDMKLAFPIGDENITAADLTAGGFKKTLICSLESVDGLNHGWAGFTPDLTVFDTVVDGAGVPVITGTPKFKNGILSIELTFPAATYLAAETAGVDVRIQVDGARPDLDDTLLGWPVAKGTITLTMV